MKNFKVFTVAMLFLAGVTTTFTSCGGGEEKKDDEKSTEATSEETTEEVVEESTEASCLGDYFGLKNDLNDIFLANVKSGAIVVGKTTKSEMEAIAGSADGFDKEYEGLRVNGYFSFEGDVLSSISLDYFYECEGALDLLSVDKSSITSTINTTLGVDGVADGDYEDAGTTWSINGQTVRQANFSDGYGVYIDAAI